MTSTTIRRATPGDLADLAKMAHRLWPGASLEEHSRDLSPLLHGQTPQDLPHAIFVAESDDSAVIAFVEVDLRSHADGCDPSRPVGYVEGWYVDPEYRRRRVGAQLIAAAEQWARSLGCREIASDTWMDHLVSQQAHQSLGFEVVDRCVHYKKTL